MYMYPSHIIIQVASHASATAGVVSLAPRASRHKTTQCLSIIEVIKLSG